MKKLFPVILIFIFFMAIGCVRQDEILTAVTPSVTRIGEKTAVPTPIPTVPPTKTPHPTFTPAPTSTIEVSGEFIIEPTPTIFPVTTPNSSAESYQLQIWNEAKATNLIRVAEYFAENVEPIIDTVADRNEIYAFGQNMVEMTIYETLVRFPETTNRENFEWQLAYAKAMQANPETTDLIIDLLEAGFENGRYTLNNLNDNLKPHRFAIREGNYRPYPKEVMNLFGQNETTDLRLITTMQHEDSPESDGVLTAFFRDNPPEIIPITSAWSRGFGSYSQIELHDFASDNRPEVIIDWNISSGGLPCHYLNIRQWQDDNFVDLDESHSLPACRRSWKLDLLSEDPMRIVSTELFPGDTITQTFSWNASTLSFSSEKSPLPQNPNPTANPYYGLFYDDAALIEVKNRIIENWTDEWADKFGASFPDVLRFQQAQLHLSLNQEEEARNLLNKIVDSPNNSEAFTISTLAEAFLNAYRDPEDTFLACTQTLQILDDLIKLHTVDGTIDYQALQNTAGFNVYRDRVVFICSPSNSLERTINAWNISGMFREKSIPEFLSQNNIIPKDLLSIDLNGDGIKDWIAAINMINPGGTSPLHILAFINSPEGMVMIPVAYLSKDELNDLIIETTNLTGYKYPIHAITSSDKPLIFAIETENNKPKLKEWFGYEGWFWLTDYDLRQSQEGETELVAAYELRPYLDSYGEVTYRWNPETQDFELVEKRADNSLGIPLDESIAQAETLLLQEGDFEAAIPILTAVLTELNATEELIWVIPRTLYLLGLAYELNGDETNAVDTYWSLWQTFPETPYALLAQAKLELKP